MPNFIDFINNILKKEDINQRIQGLMKKNQQREFNLLPHGVQRIILILEGGNMDMSDKERDPYDSLPPSLSKDSGFQI